MKFTLSHELPLDEDLKGPVKIGWFLYPSTKAGVIYEPPRRVKSHDTRREVAKSAGRCPAVINLETRYFEVLSPISLHLEFRRDKDGRPGVVNKLGKKSGVRNSTLNKWLFFTAEHEWRYPDRPTLQLKLPYTFVTDEPVYISQIAPFMHYSPNPWPGTIFGGRFPADIWPRPLMWAFEWHDIEKPLIIKRGDPLFYVHFESRNPVRSIQLVEAAVTEQLEGYLNHISGVVSHVNQTFSLFEAASRVRPESLLVPIKRKSSDAIR